MQLDNEKRVLALAGLFQAVHLISTAARTGIISQDTLEKSLNCIFVQNPASFSDIYSGTNDIHLGLNLLADVLRKFNLRSHGELLRYCLVIMSMERALSQQSDILQRLGQRITEIGNEFPDSTMINGKIAALADLYEGTLSQTEPGIMIAGNKHHLQNITNIQRIRALLLSAVRSTVLWHQVGGRRWQLLLRRSSMRSSLNNFI
ncbi:MAG TPA: high frequency lysogenization protein HflD [Pseudomonadales bacterium]|nr:high frequency lysogenization protein HflD [Pseudomonadales bacterium]MDP6315423.1 high frequency lysogenization protein HflD [Pseudomonadales bacterium]MDP7315121.1 high frequency lysogenization protein HflD [Pseudomonadales bacterium]HJL61515.1 high frequency lysogenization protein HflD [Pseudomonadales bacterium]HJP50307.1 high frequency lysogenization protein HflD [Pseudomonadales bacterium]